MSDFNVGDIVARKSYNSDVFFEIVELIVDEDGEQSALLKGLDVRLFADSRVSDLKKITRFQLKEYRKKFIKNNNERLDRIFKRRAVIRPGLFRNDPAERDSFFVVSGKVLHIDGNENYLQLCEEIYRQLGIEAVGLLVPEKEQPARVLELLEKYQPDVLVLTGHDGFIKGKKDFTALESYRNSGYFVEAVKKARRYRPNKDDLIIFAGACQSHYEALLKAGANYASSPERVFIHAFDPVFVVEKIFFTPASVIAAVNDVIDNTITGISGLGGIETRGKHRWGYPKSPY